MNLDYFIGEFLYHVVIDVEDLVAGSIQAHDSAYDFDEDVAEGVLLLWNIIVTLLLIVFLYIYPVFDCLGSSPLWRLLNY